MRVLVTGGAGFIGSHLCARLVARGDRVRALDDLSAGSAAALAGLPEVELQVASADDPQAVEDALRDQDAIVHLAASVGVRTVVEQPVRSILNNTRSTEVVLAAAAARSIPILLASSSEVYGRSAEVPFDEEACPMLGPTQRGRWSYAASKALGEWLALAHRKQSGLPLTIVRLFNTVGPGQRGESGMVLPNFARQALEGAPLRVFGDGQQTRCFAHVRDVVDALSRLLDREHRGEVFNLGSEQEWTILDVAHKVRELAGSSSAIELVDHEDAYGPGFDDLPRRVPDLRRLRAALGEVPQTPLEDILRDVLEDARRRSAPDSEGAAPDSA